MKAARLHHIMEEGGVLVRLSLGGRIRVETPTGVLADDLRGPVAEYRVGT
jgi:hypothetical protein